MWSRKRVLKKNRRAVNKKKILYASLVSGVLGIALIGVGVVVVEHEPLYISPLPLFHSFVSDASGEDAVKTIKTFLQKHDIEYESVTVKESQNYEIKLKSNGTILLTSEKSVAEQLSSLQLILSRLTMEGKKFIRLDLRYDRPVIVLR